MLTGVTREKEVATGKEHLMLTRKVGDSESSLTLLWDEPPTISRVEELLRANIGKTIKSLGDLDI